MNSTIQPSVGAIPPSKHQHRSKKQHLLNITNISRPQEKKIYVPKRTQPTETVRLATTSDNSESFVNLAVTSQQLSTQILKEIVNPISPTFATDLPTQQFIHQESLPQDTPTAKPSKRIYTKEALLSIRSKVTTQALAPPSPLPSDIIADYNVLWEKKEQEIMEMLQKDMEKTSLKKTPYSAQAWKPKKIYKPTFPQSPVTNALRTLPTIQCPATCPPNVGRATPSSLLNTPAKTPMIVEQQTESTSSFPSIFDMLPAPKPPSSPQKKNNNHVEQSSPWDSSSCDESSDGELQWVMQELSARRLETRQKQIDIGKNTLGYQNYVQLVPGEKRKRSDPQTPNKYQVCSKRSWDGQIRKWRRLLHKYDPPDAEETNLVPFS